MASRHPLRAASVPVLTIVAGIPAAPGTPSPFANRPYILLRSGYGDVLALTGVVVPGA